MASQYDQKPWLKTYPDWLPGQFALPDQSILDAFQSAASAYPENPCIHYFDRSLSYQEIGEVLDCPQGTIKTWLHRARALLAERLRERGVVFETPESASREGTS